MNSVTNPEIMPKKEEPKQNETEAKTETENKLSTADLKNGKSVSDSEKQNDLEGQTSQDSPYCALSLKRKQLLLVLSL